MASHTNTIQRLTSASCILLVLAVGWTNSEDTDLVINKPGCQEYLQRSRQPLNTTLSQPITKSIELWQALVLLISFGVFSLLVCIIYRLIRKYVFHDSHILDTFFDAGSEVNFGLIACSVVAKWAWTATFSWSTNNTKEYGLVGHFWYAAGAAIQLFLFAIVIVEIRIKSPGAKTYLQVIEARFGSAPHVLFIVFALFTNAVIAGMVMSEGTIILSSITNGIGKEVICIILSIIVGLFTVVGGVGGGIYVSYFSCIILMSIVLFYLSDVYFDPLDRPGNVFGSASTIFNITTCGRGHISNDDFSLMTFLSKTGVVEGAIVLLSSFSSVFVNQSFWQTGIVGKPGSSVVGFLSGGLVWFTIPFGAAFAFGMSYWSFTLQEGKHLVSDGDALQGLIPVFTSQKLLGKTGDWLMFTFTMVAVVTTVSGEVLSASSIIVYDVYQTYIAPFIAIPKREEVDMRTQKQIRNEEYLEYDRRCSFLKNIVIISCAVCTIPITLAILATGIDLKWMFHALAILVGSCVIPIALTITWHRITSKGLIAGVLGGLIAGVVAWLVYASTYSGGLNKFHQNTSENLPVLVATAVSLAGGGLICIGVSFCTGGCSNELLEEEQWEKTRKVDNPLLPWSIKYAPDIGAHQMVKGKPHYFTVRRTFKKAEFCAYIFGVLLSVVVILVWPACMLLLDVFSEAVFQAWTIAVLIICISATLYIILVPLISELVATFRQVYFNRQWKDFGGGGVHHRLQDEQSDNSTKITESSNIPMPAPRIKPVKDKDAKSFDTIQEADHSAKDTSSVGSNDKDRWKTFIHIDE